MQNRFDKYIQLGINLFLTLLAFVFVLILLLLGFKYLFQILDAIPWFVMLYVLLIISVPALLFLTVFIIFFKRTLRHPSAAARYVSYFIFSVALLCWGLAYGFDLYTFFKTGSRNIGDYYSYNIFLLVGSVALIFLVGILQAFTTAKEIDWVEKRREKYDDI